MSIGEAGGSTTQAGILYQNSIAALYLGQMFDPRQNIDSKKIIEVRVEAPEDVDDVVVTFANDGRLFIHVKESISKANDPTSAWGKVWQDFEKQYTGASFNRELDKMQLCSGTHKVEIVDTEGLSKRASTSQNYAEWQTRLSKSQTSLLENIKTFLSSDLKNDPDKLLAFFKCVEVEIAPRNFVENNMILRMMPESNQSPSTLFSLFRDLVGDEARVRGTHTVAKLQGWMQEKGIIMASTVTVEELLNFVYSTSSLLRHHPNTLGHTNIRLSRKTSKDISSWLLETTDEESLGVLLDQAGTGKTVVMQEVLEELESQKVNVLAIKADKHLSGVGSLDDLQDKLGLPIRVERLAGTLASQSRFVVIIDQIDALSLSMAHDQQALRLALDLISRLRSIPGVRVLISCRRFDFNSDPQLNTLKGCKSFYLEEFSEEDVAEVLGKVGLDFALLLPSTQKLLRTPLHLNLFLMACASAENRTTLQDRGFTSLQELYHFVWDQVVMKRDPDAPPDWEREQALLLMAQYMDQNQQITVPKSLFSKQDTHQFQRAAEWLSSEGILLEDKNDLGFFHQTFFDYCYARNFVEKGISLVDTLLASPQGLFQRPQLVQVLSYLRGLSDQRLYLQQVTALFKTNSLRYHLKNHLYRWFASIPSPTEHEERFMKRLIQDRSTRSQLLQFSNGNPEWFTFWRENVLSDLLNGDESGYEEAFGYLLSVIETRQKEVIEFLSPYYTKNSRMEQIIGNLILRIRTWKCPEAVQMLETVIETVSLEDRFSYYGWEELARFDPEAVCRILRRLMDQVLENYEIKKQEHAMSTAQFRYTSLKQELENLRSSQLKKVLEIVINTSALYFLDSFIPWMIKAVKVESHSTNDSILFFISDSLFRGWYDRVHVNFFDVIRDEWVHAFIKVAHEQPQAFLEKIAYLSEFPYDSIQFLVARVLREVPEQYATTSLQFLLHDPRRLKIGEMYDYDSRQLIKSIFPFLQDEQRQELEDFILTSTPLDKTWKLGGYESHFRSQLYHLQTITFENLTPKGKKRLLELERRFPGERAPDNPRRIRGGLVGPPISSDRAKKMSDRQWLRAMQKYKRGVRQLHLSKGGAGGLARLLENQVKDEPQRFFDLLTRYDSPLDSNYICALLEGLVQSEAPADLVFKAIEHFKEYEDAEVQRRIAWAVEKRAADNVPKQIIELLKSNLADPFNLEHSFDDPISGYLNTVRGASMNALMQVFSSNEDKHLYEKWAVLCYAAQNENITLRAGAIRELIYMIRHDRQRSLDLFERAVSEHSQLYQTGYADDFCYWAMGNPFKRLLPHLQGFLNSEKEEVQQRGAELVAVSLISEGLFESQEVQETMEALLEVLLTGPVPYRRGLANVFARNLLNSPCPILINGLRRLMDDEDEDVQRQIGFFLYYIKEEPHFTLNEVLRSLLTAFVDSKSIVIGGYNLGDVLWKHGLEDPKWTLSIIQRLLKNEHIANDSGWSRLDSKDLIRAVMNVHNDPFSDDDLQSQAMDTFDMLMELYSTQAQGLLAEWDRR